MLNISSRRVASAYSSRRAAAFAVSLTGLSIIALGNIAQAGPGAATPPKPKITAKQAEAAAAKKIGGKAVSSKYEFEDGRWQYAVIVNDKKGQMYEVEVNSTTGKVMDTEKTSAGEEAREAAADKKPAGKATPKSSKEDKEDKND